jgi:hypothetical protein
MHPKLLNTVLQNSFSQNIHEIKMEWELIDIRKSITPRYCACGHKIHNIFQIKNTITNKFLIVGCCCIKEFTNYDGTHTFRHLKEFAKDIGINESFEKSILNDDLILNVMLNLKKISQLEHSIYIKKINLKTKMKLSEKQLKCISRANEKIIRHFF